MRGTARTTEARSRMRAVNGRAKRLGPRPVRSRSGCAGQRAVVLHARVRLSALGLPLRGVVVINTMSAEEIPLPNDRTQATGWRLVDLAESKRARPLAAPAGKFLHICASCASPLVHPLHWVEQDDGRWLMTRRCPECETLTEGLFSDQAVHRLTTELDRGEAVLLDSVERVTHENMVEALELLQRAFAADLIFPSDFGCRPSG